MGTHAGLVVQLHFIHGLDKSPRCHSWSERAEPVEVVSKALPHLTLDVWGGTGIDVCRGKGGGHYCLFNI